MCQIIPIWMRPHVAEHLTQGLGMLTIEPELSGAFSERDNGHITLVSNAVWPCSCRRAAVCPAHGDAGDIFASEGARRPSPAPDGRGRQPPRHLQLLCADERCDGHELWSSVRRGPHTSRLPSARQLARHRRSSRSPRRARPTRTSNGPVCRPCAGVGALVPPPLRAGRPAGRDDASGRHGRRERLRGGSL